ncbi:MAG: carboxypeptidase regulatory-like domain-containing protein [Gemmatimonadetes bacterium]|nr:MAG: carboxypeptidase regulatory-like domain-containing protein [Gemmatimonadota bacterium]
MVAAPVSAGSQPALRWAGRWACLCVAALALAQSAPGALAGQQIVGRVVASDGTPLEAVAVEAWDAQRRIAARSTDRAGLFSFPADIAARAVTLRAEALGFEPLRVDVVPGRTNYRLVLQASPITLEGLTVEAVDFCELDEDPVARLLWERARARYRRGLDTLGVATYLAEADTVVPREDLGPLQLPELALSQRGSASVLRFAWTRRIAREGYAYKIKRTDAPRPYDSWVYPPLEADFAPHFVEDEFGEWHRLVLEGRTADSWSVAFCPRDDGRPFIKGRLIIAADTTIRSAEWVFETPEPVEHAGGRAFFHAPEEGAAAYLLPAEGLTWREVPGGLYRQHYERYEGWIVAPGDSVPLLPLRRRTERARAGN